jgi:hypothetical protein
MFRTAFAVYKTIAMEIPPLHMFIILTIIIRLFFHNITQTAGCFVDSLQVTKSFNEYFHENFPIIRTRYI